MLTVGLTGGIASGKTTVSRILEEKGAVVADADVLAHELMDGDQSLRAQVAAEFGDPAVVDGRIDRKHLGELVFSDPERLAALNRLVHPLVIERVERILEGWRAQDTAPFGVVQVPLLIEAGMAEIFDKIVVIVSSPEQQVKRLLEAGLTEDEALSRLSSQLQDWERLPFADLTLINKGNLKVLASESDRLFRRLEEMATEDGGN